MKIIKKENLSSSFFAYQESPDEKMVKKILSDVKNEGDQAVIRYTEKFDLVKLSGLKVPAPEIAKAQEKVSPLFMQSCKQAVENIRTFASQQLSQVSDFELEVSPGVLVGQRVIPIPRVGVYVPGGSFPLVSSLLMGAVPAIVAGVEKIIICSPPTFNGGIHPAILAAANLLEIEEVYQIGGVQAIGAMAYGTESVPAVDKIVGPGNKFVTQAKKHVYGQVGIDLLAGPTEVMIIADDSGNPEIIAADILSQAEHDPEAIAVLITDSLKLGRKVKREVQNQLDELSTARIARESLDKNGLIIIVQNLKEAVEIANKKAPEHLELQVEEPEAISGALKNFGSLFIGHLTCEVLGDYTSGLNHTLPTNTTARYSGGLNVLDFVKLPTTLKVSQQGFDEIGPAAATLAEIEGLTGHQKAVLRRR